MASSVANDLGLAARAALSLPPDAAQRLNSMASWLESGQIPSAPLIQPLAHSNLMATLASHRRLSVAMFAADCAAATTSDPRRAIVETLKAQAAACNAVPSLPSLPAHAEKEEPMHVRDPEERRQRRSAAYEMAAALADPVAQAALLRLFTTLDTDGNGFISKKEWGRAVANPEIREQLSSFFGGVSAAEIGSAFTMIDADQSGTVDFGEMVAAAKAFLAAERAADMCLTPAGIDHLRALYFQLDTDGDGKVSKKEWGKAVGRPGTRAIMQAYFGGINAAECGAMFARLDYDGSGALTFDEFVGAASVYGARSRLADMLAVEKSRRALKALFDVCDEDGNGTVDAGEWAKAVQSHAIGMAKFFGLDSAKGIRHIEKAFERIDKDKSGTLTWDEFEAFVAVRS